ncbi:hypothetical protein BLA6993_05515 [Burkholderia lata]|nr:hypothetical protein BLA6993_05515 [Burkholderia lata]
MNAADIINFHVASRLSESADVIPEGEYSALVRWISPVDGRPNRRSRPIRVSLGREFVDDFNELTEQQQDAAGTRLVESIEAELARFGYDEFSDEREPVVVSP